MEHKTYEDFSLCSNQWGIKDWNVTHGFMHGAVNQL